MDAVLERRSVRKFDLTKKIDRETLIDLCRYGQAAPTAKRQHSREFVIIDDQEIINKIAKCYKCTMQIEECNTIIAVIGKDPREIAVPEFQVIDLACATENIMIEAASRKIGSVMIGTYPIVERCQMANDILNIDDGRFVFTYICLGYPKDENAFYDSNKFDLNDVHFNRG